jgi:hypothetical protein
MDNISTHKVARFGEQVVFSALKGSKWANDDFVGGDNYDIKWEGLKINVFTSAVRKRTGFVFSNSRGFGKGICVFVGLDGDNKFFWADKNVKNKGFYGKIKEAIKEADLPERIRKIK